VAAHDLPDLDPRVIERFAEAAQIEAAKHARAMAAMKEIRELHAQLRRLSLPAPGCALWRAVADGPPPPLSPPS
jgi:hypothetical protein